MCQEHAVLDRRSINELREIASWWHGGQWSALYAFSSSGTITETLDIEIEECLPLAKTEVAESQLRDLLDFVRARLPDTDAESDQEMRDG
jgi:hypothetical protein